MAKLVDYRELLPGDLVLAWRYGTRPIPPGWTTLPDSSVCYTIYAQGMAVNKDEITAVIRYGPGDDKLIPEPDGQGTSDHEDCHICEAYGIWNWAFGEEET